MSETVSILQRLRVIQHFTLKTIYVKCTMIFHNINAVKVLLICQICAKLYFRLKAGIRVKILTVSTSASSCIATATCTVLPEGGDIVLMNVKCAVYETKIC